MDMGISSNTRTNRVAPSFAVDARALAGSAARSFDAARYSAVVGLSRMREITHAVIESIWRDEVCRMRRFVEHAALDVGERHRNVARCRSSVCPLSA